MSVFISYFEDMQRWLPTTKGYCENSESRNWFSVKAIPNWRCYIIFTKNGKFFVYPDLSVEFNEETLPVIADVLHLSPTNNIENFLRQCVENNQLFTLHKVLELS